MDEFLIYKYNFALRDKITLLLPSGAKILKAQMQNGAPVMWAMFPKKNVDKPTKRKFYIFGTGNIIKVESVLNLNHISTFEHNSRAGDFIWHLFEEL